MYFSSAVISSAHRAFKITRFPSIMHLRDLELLLGAETLVGGISEVIIAHSRRSLSIFLRLLVGAVGKCVHS